jgi:hypothetical protein
MNFMPAKKLKLGREDRRHRLRRDGGLIVSGALLLAGCVAGALRSN